MKTFKEFQRSKEWSSDLKKSLNLYDMPEKTSGYIYADQFYIQSGADHQKAYCLILGRCEYESNSLVALEKILWSDFAQCELSVPTTKPTNFDIDESLEVIWEALFDFEDTLNLDDPESPPDRAERMDDIKTAMAWITEALERGQS